MSEHPIRDLLTETMEKIKSMVDVNTIIGSPIQTPDGTTIIPVSKVTFGFGTGGSDFAPKGNAPLCFGGGGGAGVTVSPVCFLVVSRDGDARILPLNAQAETTADRIVEMIPGVFNKVSSFVSSRQAAKNTPETADMAETDGVAEDIQP